MELFRLTINDLPEIVKIEKSAYLFPWTEDNFKDELKRPLTMAIGLKNDDFLIGYCLFWHLGPEIHLLNIAVDNNWQGRGAGKKLLNSMIEFGRVTNVDIFLLEVQAKNSKAQNMYRNFGFIEVGRRPGYYQDEGDDAILMSRFNPGG